MYYIESVEGKGKLIYSVKDTKDNVVEQYTAEQLKAFIDRGIEIRGYFSDDLIVPMKRTSKIACRYVGSSVGINGLPLQDNVAPQSRSCCIIVDKLDKKKVLEYYVDSINKLCLRESFFSEFRDGRIIGTEDGKEFVYDKSFSRAYLTTDLQVSAISLSGYTPLLEKLKCVVHEYTPKDDNVVIFDRKDFTKMRLTKLRDEDHSMLISLVLTSGLLQENTYDASKVYITCGNEYNSFCFNLWEVYNLFREYLLSDRKNYIAFKDIQEVDVSESLYPVFDVMRYFDANVLMTHGGDYSQVVPLQRKITKTGIDYIVYDIDNHKERVMSLEELYENAKRCDENPCYDAYRDKKFFARYSDSITISKDIIRIRHLTGSDEYDIRAVITEYNRVKGKKSKIEDSRRRIAGQGEAELWQNGELKSVVKDSKDDIIRLPLGNPIKVSPESIDWENAKGIVFGDNVESFSKDAWKPHNKYWTVPTAQKQNIAKFKFQFNGTDLKVAIDAVSSFAKIATGVINDDTLPLQLRFECNKRGIRQSILASLLCSSLEIRMPEHPTYSRCIGVMDFYNYWTPEDVDWVLDYLVKKLMKGFASLSKELEVNKSRKEEMNIPPESYDFGLLCRRITYIFEKTNYLRDVTKFVRVMRFYRIARQDLSSDKRVMYDAVFKKAGEEINTKAEMLRKKYYVSYNSTFTWTEFNWGISD